MTQGEFIKEIEKTFIDALEIVKKKNNDYATEANPFKNFDGAVLVGVSREKACMVRMMDKVTRMSNLLEKEPSVMDESFDDTANDLINYTAILKILRRTK